MKFWRKYHKWGGIILSFFLLLFAISGILLNHRHMISSLDVDRNFLSSSYQYSNWNNASVKGIVELDSINSLYYGNIGIWQYSKLLDSWSDYNKGFSKGIDNRKISKLVLTSNNRLFAATLFGLYEFKSDKWQPILLSIKNKRIVDLCEAKGRLLILTRSEIGQLALNSEEPTFKLLPTPDNHTRTTSLFKTIWVLHSGEILGLAGKILVDLIAIIFIFLSISGIIWFIFPSLIKRAKKRLKTSKNKISVFKFSVKWHNKLGYYTVILLIFTTFTGIFLRPPLLIAIANSEVKSIPNTMLDTPNAWYDQLRGIRYNSLYDVYLVSTAKGMYALTSNMDEMVKIPNQPPVSVMGINVFEQIDDNNYLIGSFSGLYKWNPISGTCIDYMTGRNHIAQSGMGRPIGANMASGYAKINGEEVYFDYGKGVVAIGKKSRFQTMPDIIKQNSPLSMWNLALEVHTGRIFQDAFGAFYILIVPLVGLTTLALLISGLWIYLKKFKK